MDSSAQWMSSMITTSGLFSLARSISMVTASKSCSRIVSSFSRGAVPTSGSRAPSACRPAPTHSTICSRPCWFSRSRNAPTIGAYGKPPPHGHALTPEQLGLAVGERTEQIGNERLDDRGLAGAGVTTDDHKPAAVVNDIVESLAKSSTLLRPPDDVLRPHGGGRSGRFDHEHYRATSL